jgi:hypothetical protein
LDQGITRTNGAPHWGTLRHRRFMLACFHDSDAASAMIVPNAAPKIGFQRLNLR